MVDGQIEGDADVDVDVDLDGDLGRGQVGRGRDLRFLRGFLTGDSLAGCLFFGGFFAGARFFAGFFGCVAFAALAGAAA